MVVSGGVQGCLIECSAQLNTIASSAATRHIGAHPSPSRELGAGMVHGFTVAAWWAAGVLLLAALVAAMARTPEKP